MKKRLFMISIVLVVFCLFSCATPIQTTEKHRFGGQDNVTNEIVSEPVVEETTPAAAETAVIAAPVAEGPKALEVFPEGKWLDANWDALWVFYADGNVKLFDSITGELIYDFDGMTTESKMEPAGLGLKYSFRCDDTKRFYEFTKDVEGTDLQMSIDRDWTDEEYCIIMPAQN